MAAELTFSGRTESAQRVRNAMSVSISAEADSRATSFCDCGPTEDPHGLTSFEALSLLQTDRSGARMRLLADCPFIEGSLGLTPFYTPSQLLTDLFDVHWGTCFQQIGRRPDLKSGCSIPANTARVRHAEFVPASARVGQGEVT